MKRDTRRSVGAIIGLSICIATMWSLGLGGLVYAFIFGTTGAVAGGMIGERWNAT